MIGDLTPRRLDPRGPRDRRNGQTLVEFALVLPVIVLIMFGILDFGRAIYAYSTVANSAREGARVGAVNQIETTPAEDCNESRPVESVTDPHWSIKTCAATAAIALGLTVSDVSVSYSAPPTLPSLSCTPTKLSVGCIVSVTVSYDWTAATPIIGNVVGPVHMTSTSQMSIERVFP